MLGRSAVGMGAALFLGAVSVQAEAQPARYTFTTLIDSQRDGVSVERTCAAINSSGTVAAVVRNQEEGFVQLITKQSATDAPVVIADTRQAADYPTFCDNGFTAIPSDPSINDLGEVAFQGNIRRLTTRTECATPEQRARRQGVFLGSGGALTTIAHTINLPGGDFISEFLVADQSVNNLGQVAIVPELDNGDSGLFTGSRNGTFDERFLDSQGLFDTPSSRVSMNESGQIAFEDSGIWISNPDGTFTQIAGGNDRFSVGDPSINRFGTVAFSTSEFKRDEQLLGIYTGNGGELERVVDSKGPYSSFLEPSLNDLGMVAFTADLDEFDPATGRQIQGVYTGPNPRVHTVLQAGDLYEGVVVSSVVTCSESLNNAGEIAMTVFSEDPETFEVRSFVVRATPTR